MVNKETVLDWRGRNMVSADGDKIGKIDEIYLDKETDQPEWALVSTGLFGSKSSFVPIADAQDADGDVRVPFAKGDVSDAPRMDADGALSKDEEAQLYAHYGMDYSESPSDSGLPERGTSDDGDTTRGSNGGGRETDGAMTRSEEELDVGTTRRESGRVRLRKYVVTENVTKTVPVSREEVRVEREPITDANRDAATSGADLSEDEHEVVLHEEQVDVDKKAVPKERVAVGTETVTDEREISEDVRKEQVEVLDGDSAEGRRDAETR
jgi:uncharacterized protein (TIGR02271 family)